jgi:phosphoglycolate phosphatase-like HAD superfamily hydrolase
VLLFDLDGALIDSPDDLTRALNAAFAEHGLGKLSREQVESLIGQGARTLIERADSDRLVVSGDMLVSQRIPQIPPYG